MFRTGQRNLITDVAGLRVGNSSDARLKSGVTAVLCDEPFVAGVQVLGGAPGTRETDLLEPHNSVETVNAIVLSGGSAFGLDAASGVQAALREAGVGFEVRGLRIPVIPAAILFDLANGGDKDWGRYPPYRELGYDAAKAASLDFAIGTGRRRNRRADGWAEGWPRVGFDGTGQRHHHRSARRRQLRRLGHRWTHSPFLGGAVRNRRRIRRPRIIPRPCHPTPAKSCSSSATRTSARTQRSGLSQPMPC